MTIRDESKVRLAALVAVIAGNFLEFYNILIIANMSSYWVQYYFANSSYSGTQVIGWTIFGVGYLARPLGSLGHRF